MALPNPSMSFSPFAILTSAEMNDLVENIEALAAGTGLNTGAVTFAKTSGIWWEELGRATASGSVTSLSTGTIQSKKYLKIIYTGIISSTTTDLVRFNNDSGTNYIRGVSDDNAAYTNTFSQTGIQVGGGNLPRYFECEIVNIANRPKLTLAGHVIYDLGAGNLATSGNQPVYTEMRSKWANTTDTITQVSLVATVGAFQVGSEIIVLGHN